MKCLALLGLLFLAACAAPQPIYKPVTVEVPVTVPCVPAAAISHPVWPTSGVKPNDALFTQARAALAELELRNSYEVKLEAAIKACQ